LVAFANTPMSDGIREKLGVAFERFMDVYRVYGAHNHYGWRDYEDERNFRGPTFWSEDDCTFRLALELEREFPHQVHLDIPVARWSFADFDANVDKRERIDLVVSDLLEFAEDETSQQRFLTKQHELFVEVKNFPQGCRGAWQFDHVARVREVEADAKRLQRHLERHHCLVAAVLVVDDEGLFEEHQATIEWLPDVHLLLASPNELALRDPAFAGPDDADPDDTY
jgi:hypothetical protein